MQNHSDSIIDDEIKMPASHPVLATITINVIDYVNFWRMAERTAFDTNIIGHDAPQENGRMTVYVACTSRETVDRLVYAWR